MRFKQNEQTAPDRVWVVMHRIKGTIQTPHETRTAARRAASKLNKGTQGRPWVVVPFVQRELEGILEA